MRWRCVPLNGRRFAGSPHEVALEGPTRRTRVGRFGAQPMAPDGGSGSRGERVLHGPLSRGLVQGHRWALGHSRSVAGRRDPGGRGTLRGALPVGNRGGTAAAVVLQRNRAAALRDAVSLPAHETPRGGAARLGGRAQRQRVRASMPQVTQSAARCPRFPWSVDGRCGQRGHTSFH
jgi:hypothetical protein